jgi:hypothetical protein
VRYVTCARLACALAVFWAFAQAPPAGARRCAPRSHRHQPGKPRLAFARRSKARPEGNRGKWHHPCPAFAVEAGGQEHRCARNRGPAGAERSFSRSSSATRIIIPDGSSPHRFRPHLGCSAAFGSRPRSIPHRSCAALRRIDGMGIRIDAVEPGNEINYSAYNGDLVVYEKPGRTDPAQRFRPCKSGGLSSGGSTSMSAPFDHPGGVAATVHSRDALLISAGLSDVGADEADAERHGAARSGRIHFAVAQNGASMRWSMAMASTSIRGERMRRRFDAM